MKNPSNFIRTTKRLGLTCALMISTADPASASVSPASTSTQCWPADADMLFAASATQIKWLDNNISITGETIDLEVGSVSEVRLCFNVTSSILVYVSIDGDEPITLNGSFGSTQRCIEIARTGSEGTFDAMDVGIATGTSSGITPFSAPAMYLFPHDGTDPLASSASAKIRIITTCPS